MAIYDLTVSLDLKQNLNIYATCKQLDSINLICSIYNNSLQVDLSNYNVRLKAVKADLIPLVQEYTGISVNSNIVTIQAVEQLTTTAGNTIIELQFIEKTTAKKKATFNLILEVVPSTLSIDRSISTATYTLLEELENKLDQTSDFFENISEAVEINNELKTSISSGATLKTGLDTDITNGNALKTGLENSTTTADTAKSNLDNSISNANSTKNAVDASNTNAQATKTALEADIVQAQSNSFATEITNARGTYANLKARFDANDTSLSDRTKIDGTIDDTGSTNTYVIAPTPAITAYAKYQTFKFIAKTANSGASTLNVNGLGTKALVKNANKPLVTGDILANQIVTAIYDGTNFQIVPDLSTKITSMETGQNQYYSNAMMLNGWTNDTDQDWARANVYKRGNIVRIYIYAVHGTDITLPIFTLPSFCNSSWLDDGVSGIKMIDRNVYVGNTATYRRILTYVE